MNLKKSFLAVAICLFAGTSAFSQETFPVSFDLSSLPGCTQFNIALNAVEASNRSLVTLKRPSETSCTLSGDMFRGKNNIYNVYCYSRNQQYILPMYLDASTGPVALSIVDGVLASNLKDPSNLALGKCDELFSNISRSLAENVDKMSVDEMKAAISRLVTVSDSIASLPSVPAPIALYIRLWGYTSTYDAVSLAVHLRKRAGLDVPFSASDLLAPPAMVLDTPMAACFSSSASIVASSLKGNTIEEKMADLYSAYDDEAIRSRVTDSMLDSFLNNFDYKNNFDDGVARLTALTERYSLPATWVDNFKARKVTVPGTPFPEAVVLVDRNGNKVDFSSFKGKYVFVDLWASWCGPCVGEVPHMQNLEKEFEGSDDVTFVSISVDKSEDAWLKKMDQLNMHGNQLRDSSGNLCTLLNVKGIPHFLLYDRDGNLLVYKTTRPSHTSTLPMLKALK
ncbi:MAG: TlpA family protein disulfide reductase [Paenibacillus sp.]|nr:TlpA family protein disulfide reductase [Paenibacillus sp.]